MSLLSVAELSEAEEAAALLLADQQQQVSSALAAGIFQQHWTSEGATVGASTRLIDGHHGEVVNSSLTRHSLLELVLATPVQAYLLLNRIVTPPTKSAVSAKLARLFMLPGNFAIGGVLAMYAEVRLENPNLTESPAFLSGEWGTARLVSLYRLVMVELLFPDPFVVRYRLEHENRTKAAVSPLRPKSPPRSPTNQSQVARTLFSLGSPTLAAAALPSGIPAPVVRGNRELASIPTPKSSDKCKKPKAVRRVPAPGNPVVRPGLPAGQHHNLEVDQLMRELDEAFTPVISKRAQREQLKQKLAAAIANMSRKAPSEKEVTPADTLATLVAATAAGYTARTLEADTEGMYTARTSRPRTSRPRSRSRSSQGSESGSSSTTTTSASASLSEEPLARRRLPSTRRSSASKYMSVAEAREYRTACIADMRQRYPRHERLHYGRFTMEDMTALIESEDGLFLFDAGGSIHAARHVKIPNKSMVRGAAEITVVAVHGPAANPLIRTQIGRNPGRALWVQSQAQLPHFFRSQAQLLRENSDASNAERVLALHDFSVDFTQLADTVMEANPRQPIIAWAVLLHFLVVTWNRAMVHDDFSLLGTGIVLEKRWDAGFADYIPSNSADKPGILNITVQPAMHLLGYRCPICYTAGWCGQACLPCKIGCGASAATADATGASTAAQESWDLAMRAAMAVWQQSVPKGGSTSQKAFLATDHGLGPRPRVGSGTQATGPISVDVAYAWLFKNQGLVVPFPRRTG